VIPAADVAAAGITSRSGASSELHCSELTILVCMVANGLCDALIHASPVIIITQSVEGRQCKLRLLFWFTVLDLASHLTIWLPTQLQHSFF